MNRHPGQELASGNRDPRGRARWLDASLILAAALVLIGFVRLWVFSHGQMATIQVLLSSGTLANISGQWLASSVTWIVALATVFASLQLGEALREDQPWLPALLGWLALFIASLALAPAGVVLLAAIFSLGQVAYGLAAKLWRALGRRRGVRVPWLLQATEGSRGYLSWKGYLAVGLVAAVTMGLFTDTGWLVRERLLMTDGTIRIGYVAGGAEGFFTVIDDRDRSPALLRSGQVEAREICSETPWLSRSILAAVVWSADERADPCGSD